MSYVILGDLFTFPEGEAATNRVHTYAKGFFENGINVHVITFGNLYSDIPDGVYNGIYHYSPFGQKKRSKYFLVRTWKKIMKYVKTYRLIRSINREDKIGTIIVYSGLYGTFLLAWFLSKVSGSVLIQEISEHPLRYYQKGRLMNLLGFIKIKTESFLVDGIFCISHYLLDFFRSRKFPEEKLLLVPSTVDPARFSTKGENPLPYHYIGYFGTLTFERDNVDLLIEAFSVISDKHPSVHLVIGGMGRESEKTKIIDLIGSLGVGEKAHLLPFLPREEVARYICNSLILVMVRTNDFKAQASFPSKLTEYLATSRPIISVNVGEIGLYLTDNENVFLVEPGNKSELAEKIDYVLKNYDHAAETGIRGRQLSETIFHYSYQAKKMISFIESLQK